MIDNISLVSRLNTSSSSSPSPDDDYSNIIDLLISGYESQEMALQCGLMLRECIKYNELLYNVLNKYQSKRVWQLIDLYLNQNSSFDVVSDAFSTLRALLLPLSSINNNSSSSSSSSSYNISNDSDIINSKQIVSSFLESNYNKFFKCYESLILSDNYVTRRSSLKLLGELLIESSNQNILIQFVNSSYNLKIFMLLMKDKSSTIQIEAFHVFKLFVVNPRLSEDVKKVLINNKQKLEIYLQSLKSNSNSNNNDTSGGGGSDNDGSNNFHIDRQRVIDTISNLQ